jgi:hypothetical protein
VITAIIPFWIIPLMSGVGMIVASFFNELFGPNILAITSMGILSSMSLATWIFITCQLGLPIHLMMAVDSLTLILNILMMIFVLKGDFQPNIRYSITMLISAILMAGTFACLWSIAIISLTTMLTAFSMPTTLTLCAFASAIKTQSIDLQTSDDNESAHSQDIKSSYNTQPPSITQKQDTQTDNSLEKPNNT